LVWLYLVLNPYRRKVMRSEMHAEASREHAAALGRASRSRRHPANAMVDPEAHKN
jgi:hypothetical protein